MSQPKGTLRLVSRLPEGAGTCADYDQRASADGGRSLDVRAYCHGRQSEWAGSLTQWHAELMNVAAAATPWAWIVEGSRMHVWYAPIRPLLFALGLLEHYRRYPSAEVWAVGCPREVGEYIREMSAGMVDVVDPRPVERESNAGAWISRQTKEVASLLRSVPVTGRHQRQPEEVDLLVISLGLSGRNLNDRGDHYFGRVLDDSGLRTRWLYQVAPSQRAQVEAALQRLGYVYSFVHDLVSWADIYRAVKTAVQLHTRLTALTARLPALQIGWSASNLFPRRFFQHFFIGRLPVGELVLHRAVTTLMRTVTPRALMYPYEEKGIEHAWLMANAAMERPALAVGFAHAAYTQGHLYLKESRVDERPVPRPDVVAAAGTGFGTWLAAEFGRRVPVVSVGSPRWDSTPAGARDSRPGKRLHILVLASFGHELVQLSGWLERCPSLFDGWDVTVRPHPFVQYDAAVMTALHDAASATISADPPLEQQIDAADVVLFCSTSAFAEAMWRGRLCVHAEWSDLWVVDPLKGKGDTEAVPYCTAPDQLQRTLQDIAAMSETAYGQAVHAQRAVAARVYAPFDRQRFFELLATAATA